MTSYGGNHPEIVILDGARTPMAEYNGAFADVSAIDLGVHAARAALERSGTEPGEIDHVDLRQRPPDLGRRHLRRPARRR